MKTINITLFFLFLCFYGKAQSWESMETGVNQPIRVMYSDTINNILYTGGTFMTAGSDTVGCLAQWDSTGWSSMAGGGLTNGVIHSGCNTVFGLTKYQGYLHTMTTLSAYDHTMLLGRWNGTTWDSISAIEGLCRGFYEYGDTLYVLGEGLTVDSFTNENILGWNGTQWFSVINESFNFGWIKTAQWYKGKLYIGGGFETNTGIDDFAVWDGQNLQPVGGGFSGTFSAVGDMVVYQGDLYVGGDFSIAAGDPGNNIVRWDGNQWLDVDGGTGGPLYPSVLDMDIYHGYLYICGNFTTAGDIPAKRIARWDGEQWCGYDNDIEGYVFELEFHRDSMVIALGYGNIDGINHNLVAKWNGGDYVDTCSILIDNTKEQINNHFLLKIFPNPTSETLQITTDSPVDEIQIYNSIGQQVWQGQGFRDNQVRVNVRDFSEGMYIVRVQQGDFWVSEQVLVR
jgi:hypothetical protein